ncbi:MAG TPA: sterol desaturase family protein [Anditalea sp.]|nr:sterol desaturase family protein [Anditalea sp.]
MKSIVIVQKKRNESREAILCLVVYSLIISGLFIIRYQLNIPILNFIMLFGIGYLTWTFTEYYLHRFLMHNTKSESYKMHMHHHKHPTEIKITLLQRIVFFLTGIALLTYAVYLDNYFTCFVGFYFGFVMYTVLHVILHHRFGKYILPRVQIAHIHHHGKYPETGYSFSTILWDYMFGTMAPKDAVITEQMIRFYFKDEHHHPH